MISSQATTSLEHINSLKETLRQKRKEIKQALSEIDDLNQQQKHVQNVPSCSAMMQIPGWQRKLLTSINIQKSDTVTLLQEQLDIFKRTLSAFEEGLMNVLLPLSETYASDSLEIIEDDKKMIEKVEVAFKNGFAILETSIEPSLKTKDSIARLNNDISVSLSL